MARSEATTTLACGQAGGVVFAPCWIGPSILHWYVPRGPGASGPIAAFQGRNAGKGAGYAR